MYTEKTILRNFKKFFIALFFINLYNKFMDLYNYIIKMEDEFLQIKKNIEKNHLFLILIYFTPLLTIIIILSKFFKEIYYLFIVRLIIFILFSIGVIGHFILKNSYWNNNKKYNTFIKNKLTEINPNYKEDEQFKIIIYDTIKNINNNQEKKLDKIFVNRLYYHIGIKNKN